MFVIGTDTRKFAVFETTCEGAFVSFTAYTPKSRSLKVTEAVFSSLSSTVFAAGLAGCKVPAFIALSIAADTAE